MLKVSNLTKSYGSLKVLKGISFETQKGGIYGFLGQNGAGKSTTMNILAGLIGYDSGDIYLNGKPLKENKRELLQKIGYLPQNPVFYNYMTAIEYLNFIGEINHMPSNKIKSRTEELLEIVNLKEAGKRKLGGYSGGMKQRFGIAVSIFNNPEILFLDEPTSALDPEGRMEVLEFIQRLQAQGTTVFLSTHILNDIERICNHVSIIHEGEIIISEGLENLKNKYIQPIYDVEFIRNCENLKEKLRSINWIDNIVINKNHSSIYVNNMKTASEELLKILINENSPITSFNLRQSNLEDIFLRLVNRHGNL
jgi:ABC-2 type transport system ATP-binding protein